MSDHSSNVPFSDRFSEAINDLGVIQFTPVSDPVEVGKAIRDMRLSLCQTQGFMADLFGIPVSHWSALEKGNNG